MSKNRESLIAKIRALLSKTIENGCTEAEAMSALSMAQSMMDAYEVTEEDIELKGETAHVNQSDMRDTHNIRNRIAVAIASFTETKVWSSGKAIKFCGLQSDTEFAVWLTDTLAEFVRKELKNYIWGNNLTSLPNAAKRVHINGFVIGCTIRISQRINELVRCKNQSVNSTALVVAKQALVQRKMQELGLNLTEARSRGSRMSGDSYAAGKQAGDKASFGRPVGGQSATLRIK